MTARIEDYLQQFLVNNGEEAWKGEVQRLAVSALRTGSEKHEEFWRDLTKEYTWLDWGQLEQQVQPDAPSPDRLIAEALKSQMPGIKSQAQYDAVVGALEATKLVINALLTGNRPGRQEARAALETAFEAVEKATELTDQLLDSPEAATSDAARQFKETPAQYQEADLCAELLQELPLLNDIDDLSRWYAATKARRDKITTQSLRNEMMDAIRARRNGLAVG